LSIYHLPYDYPDRLNQFNLISLSGSKTLRSDCAFFMNEVY